LAIDTEYRFIGVRLRPEEMVALEKLRGDLGYRSTSDAVRGALRLLARCHELGLDHADPERVTRVLLEFAGEMGALTLVVWDAIMARNQAGTERQDEKQTTHAA